MVIKTEIANEVMLNYLDKLTNKLFRILPTREEKGDWLSLLQSVSIEVSGLVNLLDDQVDLLSLLSKLEALSKLQKEEDFLNFRKLIFECLDSIAYIKKHVKS